MLGQERQAMDAELLEVFSGAEPRMGLRAPGGWLLRQRTRARWDDPAEVRDAGKGLQQQAQRDGRAQRLASTCLGLTLASA